MSAALQIQRIELNDSIAKEMTAAVEKTILTMFSARPKPEAWRVEGKNSVAGDVSGLIGFVQDRLEATMAVCFPRDLAIEMMSHLVRRPLTEVDGMVKSGVGELANVIFGVMKAKLNQSGFTFQATIPTVVVGNNHVLGAVTPAPTLIMPFELYGKRFHVLLTIIRE